MRNYPRFNQVDMSVVEVSFIKGRPLGLDIDDNLCVRAVHPDSQGEAKGIGPFWSITELNGKPIASALELRQGMSHFSKMAEMTMTLLLPYNVTLLKGPSMGLSFTDALLVHSIAPDSQVWASLGWWGR